MTTPQVRTAKAILLVLGLLFGLWLLTCDPDAELGVAGVRALAVAWIALVLWLLAPIPLAATGLLVVMLLPALGVIPQAEAFSYFGNSAVFFLLGVFILTGAVIRTGLSKRTALLLLSRFGATPTRLLLAVLAMCMFLAFWMPEHAVAAMAFPVVLEVARSLRLERGASRYGTALFLALAWGAITGGVGTLLGGARAPLALEIVRTMGGAELGFLGWAAAGVPISLLTAALGFGLLRLLYAPEITSVQPARRVLQAELARIGPLTGPELRAGLLVLVCVGLWVSVGLDIGLALISIGAAVAVFALRIATWSQLIDYVNWNVIVMYGGAVALGRALLATGAVAWLAARLAAWVGIDAGTVVPFTSGLAIVLSQGISNAASVVVVLPMALGIGAQWGVPVAFVTLATAVAAGLAFCLPISTPPNAIIHDSGYVRTRQMLGAGCLMTALSWGVLLLVAWLLWPRLPGFAAG